MTKEDLRGSLDMVLGQLRQMEGPPDASRLAFLSRHLGTLSAEARSFRDDPDTDPAWMLRLDGDLDEAGLRLRGFQGGAGEDRPGPRSWGTPVSPADLGMADRTGYMGTMARPLDGPRARAADRFRREKRPRRSLEQFIGGSVMSVLAAGLIFIAMILMGMTLLPALPPIGRLAVLAVASCAVGGMGYAKASKDWGNKAWLTVLAIGVGGLFVTAMLASMWYDSLFVQVNIYVAILGWALLCRVLSRKSDVLFTAISQLGVALAAIAAYGQGFEAHDELLMDMLPAFLLASGVVLLYRNRGAGKILASMCCLCAVGCAVCSFYTDSRMRSTWFGYGPEPMATSLPSFFGQMLLLYLVVVAAGAMYIILFRSDGRKGRVAFQGLLLLMGYACAGLVQADGPMVAVAMGAWCLLYAAIQPGALDAFPVIAAFAAVSAAIDAPVVAMVFLAFLLNIAAIRGQYLLQGACVGYAGYVLFVTLIDMGSVPVAAMALLFALNVFFWDCRRGIGRVDGLRAAGYAACVAATGYAALAMGHALSESSSRMALSLELSAGTAVGLIALVALCSTFYSERRARALLEARAFDDFVPRIVQMGLAVVAAVAVCGFLLGDGGMVGTQARVSFVATCAAFLVAASFARRSEPVLRAVSVAACVAGLVFLIGFSYDGDPAWHFAAVVLVLAAHSNNLRWLAESRVGPYWIATKSMGLLWCVVQSYDGPSWLSTASFFVLAGAMLYAGYKMGRRGVRLAGMLVICFGICKLLLLDLDYGSDLARTASFFFAGVLCLGVSMAYHRLGVGRQDGSGMGEAPAPEGDTAGSEDME